MGISFSNGPPLRETCSYVVDLTEVDPIWILQRVLKYLISPPPAIRKIRVLTARLNKTGESVFSPIHCP